MSTLYAEEIVDVVTMTLTKKTGGTETISCAMKYWEAGALYSGSPECLPLLARSPVIGRRAGRIRAELIDVQIECYGQTHSTKYGYGLIDRGDLYEWNNSTITCYKYVKTTGALTTHSDDSNMRITGRISNVQSDGDLLSLTLRDVWFKEKELCKKLLPDHFPDIEDDWVGEYGPIVFGNSVIVPVVFIEDADFSEWSGQAAKLLLGFVATDHPLKSFNQLYARNTEGPNDPEWVPITTHATGSGKIHGNQYETGFGDTDSPLNEGRCVVYSPGPGDNQIIYGVNIGIVRTASAPASTDGEIRVWIARAPNFLSAAGVWQEERVLREARIDFSIGTTLASALALFDRPLVATENENYIHGYEWTKPGATNGYKLRYKASGTNSGDNPQKRDNNNRGQGWAAVSEDPAIAVYGLTKGTDGSSGFVDSSGTAPFKYSYLDLQQQPWGVLSPSVRSSGTDGRLNRGLQLQASVSGLEDDATGTYTGTANGIIKQPPDIIKFLLLENEIGLGLDSSVIVSSSFDSARTLAAANNSAMSFYRREYILIGNLIEEICFQSRMRIYKTRTGKIALNYPAELPSVQDFYVSKAKLQNDLRIVRYADLSDSDVVNDFLFSFAPDPLNTPKDSKIFLRNGSEKYSGIEYLNGSENSLTDPALQAIVSASEAMYGKKQMRTTLWAYSATSEMPAKLMRYYAGRYSNKQRRITVRLPISDYIDAELFQTMNIQHTDLPASGGTLERVQWSDGGSPVSWYDEGVPAEWSSAGIAKGEIVELQESEDWLYVTIETMHGFEG